MITFETSNHDGVVVVSLDGDLDALVATGVTQALAPFAADGTVDHVILEISRVRFMDSSGVGAIVHLHKRLRQRGAHVSLHGARGQPRTLIELLRIDQAIPTLPKEAGADTQGPSHLGASAGRGTC
jgi:anti-anti-sigma factor